MLRRTITAVSASLLLSAGLLTGGGTASPAAAAPTYDNSIGIVKAPHQVLRKGCRQYVLRWSFTPPNDEWTVTARIRSPRGTSVRSEFWDAGGAGKLGQRSGTKTFPLCRASVTPGRYKIEMQMIYNDGRDVITKNRQPTYFWLKRR